jgi:Rps23 Pro-64 3,4-dihydroxylase Tpa1-like proline 4-hydroxylase
MIIEQEVIFDDSECNEIITLSKINQQKWDSMDRTYTSSTIRYEEDNKWVFDKLSTFFEEKSGLKILKLKTEIHFHIFNPTDKFKLHNDTLDSRLFSVGVLLNDNFEGGDFKLYNPNEFKLNKVIGNCYLFDVGISHEITPVLSGTRYSLIWFIQNDNVKTTPKKII